MRPVFWILLLVTAISKGELEAQPYFDIAHIKFMYSPDQGAFNRSANHEKIKYTNVNLNLPVALKLIHGIAVINPYFEK